MRGLLPFAALFAGASQPESLLWEFLSDDGPFFITELIHKFNYGFVLLNLNIPLLAQSTVACPYVSMH